MRVVDRNTPANLAPSGGFLTDAKQSREGGLVMQMSELEKDEMETPGHHVLFPVLSN